MSLIYQYRLLRAAGPVIPLDGRLERPKTLIHVTLIGPKASVVQLGLADPGADDTVFSASVAAQGGIDLSAAPSGTASGVGMVSATLQYARVKLRVATATERREWEGWVGFTATPLHFPLLGFAGFLQFFTAEFDGENERLTLSVNGLYPGT